VTPPREGAIRTLNSASSRIGERGRDGVAAAVGGGGGAEDGAGGGGAMSRLEFVSCHGGGANNLLQDIEDVR
jgi:hypothetical protein